jgi:hypothetical protein
MGMLNLTVPARGTETGFAETAGDLPEADFWPIPNFQFACRPEHQVATADSSIDTGDKA